MTAFINAGLVPMAGSCVDRDAWLRTCFGSLGGIWFGGFGLRLGLQLASRFCIDVDFCQWQACVDGGFSLSGCFRLLDSSLLRCFSSSRFSPLFEPWSQLLLSLVG